MTTTEDSLGGRLLPLNPSAMPAEQRKLYDRIKGSLVSWAEKNGFQGQTADGRLIGPFNAFVRSVGVTPGFLEWMDGDSKHTTLDKRVHEVVILTVGAIWASPYELYSHSVVARNVGISEMAIEALRRGESSEYLTSSEQIAHRFAKHLVVERRIEAHLYDEAKTAFGENGLVDLVYLVGMYLMTCAMLNAFEIPAPG